MKVRFQSLGGSGNTRRKKTLEWSRSDNPKQSLNNINRKPEPERDPVRPGLRPFVLLLGP
jgi:hypothetical protein